VSLLYAMGGARFGPGWGLALATVAIVLHLLLSWWIGHSWLKRPLHALLHALHGPVPHLAAAEEVPVCLLVSLVPGVPYAIKNYALALAGVRFRTFFWVCLPAHFFHAVPGVWFGDFTRGFTPGRIIWLLLYVGVLAGLTHGIVRRLRARRRMAPAPPPPAGTPGPQ
jgi:uncharacterized membrane protein YdjX (TVP38/TMEM64 family)